MTETEKIAIEALEAIVVGVRFDFFDIAKKALAKIEELNNG